MNEGKIREEMRIEEERNTEKEKRGIKVDKKQLLKKELGRRINEREDKRQKHEERRNKSKEMVSKKKKT